MFLSSTIYVIKYLIYASKSEKVSSAKESDVKYAVVFSLRFISSAKAFFFYLTRVLIIGRENISHNTKKFVACQFSPIDISLSLSLFLPRHCHSSIISFFCVCVCLCFDLLFIRTRLLYLSISNIIIFERYYLLSMSTRKTDGKDCFVNRNLSGLTLGLFLEEKKRSESRNFIFFHSL